MSGTARARALFVLLGGFVPAHLHTVRVVRGKRGPMAVAVLRLPLQVPMVQAALPVARAR